MITSVTFKMLNIQKVYLAFDYEVKLAVTMLVIASITYWVYVQKQWRSLRKLLPPGPRCIPVLGNMHQVGRLPHQSFHGLSKKYGPLMYLRLGSIPTVVISSSNIAKEVFKVHDHALASRPRTTAVKYMLYDGATIAFAQYGADWRLKRKICTLELFTSKRLQEYKNMRMEEICALLKSIYKDSSLSSGGNVDVSGKFSDTGLNVVSRMMLNKRIASGETTEFKTVLHELLPFIGAFNLEDFIPYLAWIDPSGCSARMKKIHRRIDHLLEDIINEHELTKTEKPMAGPKDLLDVLLNAGSDGAEKEKLSRRSIKAVVLDMFIGASDTSSHAVHWAMAELLRNPTLLKQAQLEIDSAVGYSRKVEESDLSELKFVRAIVKETFRLHPVLPMLIPRECLETCKIGGYIIPAATRVYINAWAIGRDPGVWKRPLEFYPERFLLESSHIHELDQDCEFIPFGGGRRRCPGMPLGLCIVQQTLASLLHCFDWCLPDGQLPEGVDMQEAPGIVMSREKNLVVVPTPRKATHSYVVM
ncbi:hypothetical protein O6H91_18G048300 [Diphasiastrum complanatum]|uniref:Uncharacterized protein n=2 Tax=Diphasiastrum complanatum TaxID=34168 RepID=A0ACC2AXV3_DIPCM|nr:hypothetical protein O6H91_18G008100 [Diphasiastrum complanatum]KAJ7523356.1 hypothetical protein O6H91_18G048300 [Diphasiastrum complanatum]